MKLVSYEIHIAASADDIFRLLTEADGLTQWMAVEAVADPVPEGELRWRHQNGATMAGRFKEIIPPHRVVFSYGWADGQLGLPPESSLVEIDLVEQAGGTLVRLVHSKLPDETADDHRRGWEVFLSRLRDLVAH